MLIPLPSLGSLQFEAALAREWLLEERIPLPCWGDTADDLTVWRRRSAATEAARAAAPPAGCHPVLRCDTCGKRGGLGGGAGGAGGAGAGAASKGGCVLRRCVYSRLACYCSEACAAAGREAHLQHLQLRMVALDRPPSFHGNDFAPCC